MNFTTTYYKSVKMNNVLLFLIYKYYYNHKNPYLETSQTIPHTRLFLICHFALSVFPYQWNLCQVSFVGKKAGHSFAHRIVLR